MAFKKILVALDRSPQTASVFEQALEQTRPGSALLLAHVVRLQSDIPAGAFMGIGTIADVDTYATLKHARQERMQREIKQAQAWLQPYYQQAIARHVTTEINCQAGEPSTVICELANQWNADLIVLGRRGYQGIKEVVLGSVSNYVVHHAACSVLIVQGVELK